MPRPITPPHVRQLNEALGKRVAERRGELGVSVRTLETALSLPRGALSRIERGERSLDACLLHELSLHLEVPVDHFFKGLSSDGAKVPPTLPSAEQVAELSAFLNEFHAIASDTERRQISALVRALAGVRNR